MTEEKRRQEYARAQCSCHELEQREVCRRPCASSRWQIGGPHLSDPDAFKGPKGPGDV